MKTAAGAAERCSRSRRVDSPDSTSSVVQSLQFQTGPLPDTWPGSDPASDTSGHRVTGAGGRATTRPSGLRLLHPDLVREDRSLHCKAPHPEDDEQVSELTADPDRDVKDRR